MTKPYMQKEDRTYQVLRQLDFRVPMYGMQHLAGHEGVVEWMNEQRQDYKQVIVMRSDLDPKPNRGKEIAQACHASVNAMLQANKHAVQNWRELCGDRKVTLKATEAELIGLAEAARIAGLPHWLVVDEGKTYFKGVHTITALGIGPSYAPDINELTGGLSLY